MKTDDFDFELPEELIAQTPLKNRDTSKLLVLDKETGKIEDKSFKDIIDYLNPGDVLVMNNTKVIPARLYGIKEETQERGVTLSNHLFKLYCGWRYGCEDYFV